MRKIKTGDEIFVIAGKNKGSRGQLLRVVAGGKQVVVEGVNMMKKHVKPNPQANVQGGIIEKEAPLNISNVAIFNPVTQRPDRVGFKTLEDGRKVRYFKSNGELVEI
jgi:large subunit ribosomal protein L24